jgi:hypothetical protein
MKLAEDLAQFQEAMTSRHSLHQHLFFCHFASRVLFISSPHVVVHPYRVNLGFSPPRPRFSLHVLTSAGHQVGAN